MTVDLEGARCEEEAARLLPWYLTGRLSAADLERVSSHLRHCAICRNDLAHERALLGLLKTNNRIEYAPRPGLAKVLSPGTRRRFGPVQWLTVAVLVQALALAWLGAASRYRPQSAMLPAPYQTLSADAVSPVAAPRIRAVFAPAMTLAELKALLASNDLTIVRSPSDAGAYTLASTRALPAGPEPVVAALRTDARVLFVEAAVNDTPAVR
jgi:Putative zinc-finger